MMTTRNEASNTKINISNIKKTKQRGIITLAVSLLRGGKESRWDGNELEQVGRKEEMLG